MKNYDLIIVGAGVTGLASAMYAGRLNLKTLVIGTNSSNELPIGGVITLTEVVENYPGFIKLTGSELAENIRKHALDYKDNVSIEEDLVLDVKKYGNCFSVSTKSGKKYLTKTVLFATGTKWRKLQMKGAKEFESKGVHYCSLCDGALFKNKIVAVIGGSDSAAKEALLSSEYAKKVYIIYRGEKIRPEPINEERIKRNKKIIVITNTNILEIKGGKFVTHVVLDKKYNRSNILMLDGVFGAIGSDPLSGLAKKLGIKINDKKEIIINHATSKTNVKGVYAAGDVADKEFKQAITGVAEGVTATYSAYKYINENNLICTT
ncbi:MAG: NAD(P)/FAD-dependent oxidoreductase [Nanoarchaeota archaeon]|mgnify:CR=1 FL=1